MKKKGVAFLIESELEKAEVVLATKSVLDKLQKTAEAMAKVEAEDVMPLLDRIKLVFGPQHSERFGKIASERLRSATEAVSASKDAISNEVVRFEKIVNGEEVNDMAMDDSDFGADINDMAMDDDMEGMEPARAADDLEDEVPGDEEMAPAPQADELGDDEEDNLPDIMSDNSTENAAGRARKESFVSGRRALQETRDPDRLVLDRFRTRLREGFSPAKAAFRVASDFEIEVGDVIDVVRTFKGR